MTLYIIRRKKAQFVTKCLNWSSLLDEVRTFFTENS